MTYKKVNYKGLPVITTTHAKQRFKECGIKNHRHAVFLFMDGFETKADSAGYKVKKYGEKAQQKVRYVQNGSLLFVFEVRKDKRDSSKDIVVIITITDQRINYKGMF